MTKAIYEVLDEVGRASTPEDKINILRSNDSFALRCVLRAALHPRIRFVLQDIPPYRPSEDPAGLSPATLHMEIERIYLFEENNPRVSPNLTIKRREIILTQILESLEPREAEVLVNVFKKDLQVPGLTNELVDEALPGVLAA